VTLFLRSEFQMPDFRKPNPTVMLVCASVILTLALGIRHSFGLFLQPMSMDNGWGREVFGFAVALQNLLWASRSRLPACSPTASARARALRGGLLYALGWCSWRTDHRAGLDARDRHLVSIGMSCTSFNIVFAHWAEPIPRRRGASCLASRARRAPSASLRCCRSRSSSSPGSGGIPR
jgi:hypothetical protein